MRVGVRGIPNFVVLTGGRVVGQRAGLLDRRALRAWLEQSSGGVREEQRGG
jgi:hypothetical protein